MCIMEIHAGAAKATMAQAVWHNTVTVITDCQMLGEIFESRGDVTSAKAIMNIQRHLETVNGAQLDLFRHLVDQVHGTEISSTDDHGNERTVKQIAQAAGKDADRDYARPTAQDHGIWQGLSHGPTELDVNPYPPLPAGPGW